FYLCTYWLLEVTARIFESGMLPILFAGLLLTGWRRPAFLTLIVVYGAWIRERIDGVGGWAFEVDLRAALTAALSL
ncbi:MAG TPA: hypothetical protein VK973_08880, partial [Arenicellales bacterium]|nr:hypothetical protein [Arenicellales bacterium]